MAALSTVRPLSGGLLRPQATRLLQTNCIAIFSRAKILAPSQSDVTTSSSPMPQWLTQLRRLQTSSLKTARFQRPLPLHPDDVDWSKMESLNSPYKHSFDPDLVERLLDKVDNDMPLADMPDPFEKNYRRCFLCRNDVHLDHKNVRLLSQFVSPYTGRIYGRAITGLCIPMQKRVAGLIKRSRESGYMPYLFKDAKYLHDPQPYDVMARKS